MLDPTIGKPYDFGNPPWVSRQELSITMLSVAKSGEAVAEAKGDVKPDKAKPWPWRTLGGRRPVTSMAK